MYGPAAEPAGTGGVLGRVCVGAHPQPARRVGVLHQSSHCLDQRQSLDNLSLEELQTFSPLFDRDVYAAIALEASVDRRQVRGGPARAVVAERLKAIRAVRGW